MKITIKRVDAAVLAIFAIAVLCGYSGCTKQKRQSGLTLENGRLTVGVEIGYPPMEYCDADGTLTGFDIDLTKAMADTMGFSVTYVDTAWEGIFAGLDTDKYDVAVNITILPARQKNYNFTKPYIGSAITIVTLKESPLKFEKPEDLEGYRVCYQGDTTAQYFTEKLNTQGVHFANYSYDKILNCFDDLRLGRVDVVVVDNIVASDYAQKEDSLFEIVWQGPPDEYIGFCLKKGNDALTNALNNALNELIKNGTLLWLSQKIFNADFVSLPAGHDTSSYLR